MSTRYNIPSTPRLILGEPSKEYDQRENTLMRRTLEIVLQSFLRRFQVLEADPEPVASYTVADLPAPTVPSLAFASDGRKSGEGAGSGTGVLVYWDGSAWVTSDDSTPVAS